MTDAPAPAWPDESKPGVPLNPHKHGAHWLQRKPGSGGLEAWAWDPDADGCGTEYSGAWQEGDGDGQPEDIARWFIYLGPCHTPAEVAALVAQARRAAFEEAAAAYADRFWKLDEDDVPDAIRALAVSP
jgi:hypothetical protein